jgi:N-acetylmuramoyl-L-alanine amidase
VAFATAALGALPALAVAASLKPASLEVPETAAACHRAAFRLLIDVGHTSEAPGAVSARGVDEYDFNLTLANELAKALRTQGFIETTVMITQGASRPALLARVAKINQVVPNLMLSIHHDSVPDRFLETFQYDDKPHRFSDRFAGHSIFVSASNAHYAASVLFARLMGKEMKEHGLHYTPHYTEPFMGERRRVLIDSENGVYRYDQLLVLKNTHVPSVLLEAGSIINREEEWKLHLPQYRAPIVASIVEAVDRYCRLKPPAATTVAEMPEHLIVDAPIKVAAVKKHRHVKSAAKAKMTRLAHAGRK